MGKNIINISGSSISGINMVNGKIISGNLNNSIIEGNGNYISKDFSDLVSNQLERLVVSGTFDVKLEINPNAQSSFIVKGEENLIDLLEFNANFDSINIGGFKNNSNFSSTRDFEFILTVPSLSHIKSIGTGDIKGSCHGEKIIIESSGTGDIKFTGLVDILDIRAKGTGDFKIKSLCANHIYVTNSGTSDLKVWAIESIEGVNRGTGDISIDGKPKNIDIKNIGLGEIINTGLTPAIPEKLYIKKSSNEEPLNYNQENKSSEYISSHEMHEKLNKANETRDQLIEKTRGEKKVTDKPNLLSRLRNMF